MVKRHADYLDQYQAVLSCTTCHSQLVDQQDVVSRSFHGRNGPAFLVEKVANMYIGNTEIRMLNTGIHTVADISCHVCRSKIGWIYMKAHELNQKYKEGKCVVEKSKVIKEYICD